MTLPNQVVSAYVYNTASELTGMAWSKADATVLGSLGYGYDDRGRQVAQTGTYAPQTLPAASTGTNTFDDNHRQTAYNGQALSYDLNGNLINDGIRTYVWNTRNQLTAIQQGTSTLASFSYDALGRRIGRNEEGTNTTYLYDGLNAVQETRGATVIPVLTGLGTDQRFARTEASGRTYFLTDLLGSTRALTDSSGTVVNRYDYDAYGTTTQTATTFTNPYQYTGREKDANGLYYYRARYYHPGMARFISEDPIGLAGGLNTYAYVGGNPVSFVDPLGLFDVRAYGLPNGGGYQYTVRFYSARFGEVQRTWGPSAAGGVSKIAKWIGRASKLTPDPAGVSRIPDADKRKQCDNMDAEAERIFNEQVNETYSYQNEASMVNFLDAFFGAHPEMASVYRGGTQGILEDAQSRALGWGQ